jgi:hypothetical protein
MKIHFVVFALALLLPETGRAAAFTAEIIGGNSGGGVQIVPQPDTVTNASFATNDLYAWTEAQNYTLTSALVTDQGNLLIPAGSEISSYGFAFAPQSVRSLVVRITFAAPVLGLIHSRSALEASDFLGGASSYAQSGLRGFDSADSATIAGNTLTVSLNASYIDNFRVITAAAPVPEPAGWAMPLAGTSVLGAALRSRRRTGTSLPVLS